jgi:hypothetical protein
MKDSPVACATLGLSLTATKIGVFGLSAAMAGLAGALGNRQFANTDFDLLNSMLVTMLAVVGGIGAVGGALFGGVMLGSIQTILPTVFAKNAIGWFKSFEISVPQLSGMAPGFIGINLGKNPSGAITQLADGYRAVASSPETIGLAIGGPVIAWLLARSGTINNWTFVALITVMVFAVIPLVPVLVAPIPGGRALPAGMWCIAALVATGALDWQHAISSNGLKVVGILAATVVTAAVGAAVHGAVPRTGPPLAPSPDMIGIDAPLSRNDVMDAERALGLSAKDFV